MASLSGIRIIGENINTLRMYHRASIISIIGEKLIRVPYNIGFETKYTYGRIGDVLCSPFCEGNEVCIPSILYEEFSSGWFKYDKGKHLDPFIEYYEEFAKKHADKIIRKPQTIKFNSSVMKMFLLLIVIVVVLVFLIEQITNGDFNILDKIIFFG